MHPDTRSRTATTEDVSESNSFGFNIIYLYVMDMCTHVNRTCATVSFMRNNKYDFVSRNGLR